jgi:hypothetical protein
MPDAVSRDTWPALVVQDWASTRELLHLWSQILGKLRMGAEPMLNHWWQVTLYVSAHGLTTGVIHDPPHALELELDLVDHVLRIRSSRAAQRELALTSGSVAEFYFRVMAALADLGHKLDVWPVPVEMPTAIPFPEDRSRREYQPDHAHRFWRQLLAADRVLKTFRGEFAGKSSPVHFFWGSFDMAVTRFSGRPAPRHPGGAPNCPDWVMVEGYSHELTSCGFWPGGGQEGAFYAYAYPEPPGYSKANPGPPEAHYDQQLQQFILPYEAARTAPDPDALVLEFLRAAHHAAARLGHWDAELNYSSKAR